MSAGRDELRDLIEAHASGAQRGPLARLQDEYDDDDNERAVTVGDAIEGAAVTTSDSARQAAALVFNQPTHDTTQGRRQHVAALGRAAAAGAGRAFEHSRQ